MILYQLLSVFDKLSGLLVYGGLRRGNVQIMVYVVLWVFGLLLDLRLDLRLGLRLDLRLDLRFRNNLKILVFRQLLFSLSVLNRFDFLFCAMLCVFLFGAKCIF